VDGTEILAHLIRAVEEPIAFVEKHGLHGADIGNVRRRERWSTPPIAVRETVVNAVVHADYAQRARPFVSLSSTTGSRWRILGSCRSGSRWKICREGFPDCEIA